MTADPSRLSDAERRVLVLLGEGHTAKSIAAATGLSVNAVNERLREARRKTGVGSSRELARLLRLQENRDEKIEVADATSADGEDRDEAAPRRASGAFTGAIIVSFLVAGVAGLALFTGTPQDPAADPRLSGIVSVQPKDVKELHRELRLERRDARWAPEMERRLRVLYAAVPAFGNLRVLCAATLCEVVGDMDAPPINHGAFRTAQQVGRSEAIAGLRSVSVGMGPATDGPDSTFVAYWRREQAGRAAATTPRVIATVPAEETRIAPGPFALGVTFDRPMRADGWSLVGDPARLPDCAKLPQVSADGRTFTFTCRAESGRGYLIGFNGGRFRNFRSREGLSAEPHVLRLTVR